MLGEVLAVMPEAVIREELERRFDEEVPPVVAVLEVANIVLKAEAEPEPGKKALAINEVSRYMNRFLAGTGISWMDFALNFFGNLGLYGLRAKEEQGYMMLEVAG